MNVDLRPVIGGLETLPHLKRVDSWFWITENAGVIKWGQSAINDRSVCVIIQLDRGDANESVPYIHCRDDRGRLHLFLDELPEFDRNVLEILRQPLEDGNVTIARAAAALTYPAKFTLIAAMNPCPCGFFGDSLKPCSCSAQAVHKYLQRISGPLLDRIDIHIEVPRLKHDELTAPPAGETSQAIRERVERARAIQSSAAHSAFPLAGIL